MKRGSIRIIARGEILGIPNTLLCMAAMMLLTQFLLRKTRTGRALYMVGSNKVATYASGINAHNSEPLPMYTPAFVRPLPPS